MTSYVTKTTNHFQNFSDLSMNIFISHIFVTVDATNNFLHPETLLPQLPWSLLFISSCHLNWLVSLSSTLSSLLTQPVLLANFICTHILKFQLYANHLHIFVSSPWVPYLDIHYLRDSPLDASQAPCASPSLCPTLNSSSLSLTLFSSEFSFLICGTSICSVTQPGLFNIPGPFNIHLSPELHLQPVVSPEIFISKISPFLSSLMPLT